jgi:hypothetical protein
MSDTLNSSTSIPPGNVLYNPETNIKRDRAKIARARRKYLISQKRTRTGVTINGNTNLLMLSINVNQETVIKRDQAKVARARRKYLITQKRTKTNVIINGNTKLLMLSIMFLLYMTKLSSNV